MFQAERVASLGIFQVTGQSVHGQGAGHAAAEVSQVSLSRAV